MTRFPSALASLFLAFSVLLFGVARARALTTYDLAGVYQGSSIATLPNGQTVTANLNVTLKPHGREIITATTNGQTTTSKGLYQFVSDDVILGTFPASEFTAFVALNGSSLVLTLLAKGANGEIVSEVTTLTLVKKL